jgi:protein SCO1/2
VIRSTSMLLRGMRTVAALLVLAIVTPPSLSAAANNAPRPDDVLAGIDVRQRLGEALPLDAVFTDESGARVELGDYFGDRPVVLALVYYECPMLCTLVLNGLVKALRAMKYEPGDEFEIVVVSFDPEETPDLAAAKKAKYVDAYDRDLGGEGWHFLTGDVDSIGRLTEAAGFDYVYDPQRDEYAHAATLMIVTPEGKLARYLFGVEYSSRDLQLAVVEASQGTIGGVVERFLLFCYHYDPALGRYSAAAMNLVRLGGIATVSGMVIFFMVMRRRERRRC